MFSKIFGRKKEAQPAGPSAAEIAQARQVEQAAAVNVAEKKASDVAQRKNKLASAGSNVQLLSTFIRDDNDANIRLEGAQQLVNCVEPIAAQATPFDQSLEQLALWAREHDRRVYKLLKETIETRAKTRHARAALSSLIERAQHMQTTQSASANHLVELDKELAQLDAKQLEADQLTTYQHIRNSLTGVAEVQAQRLREVNLMQRELTLVTTALADLNEPTLPEFSAALDTHAQSLAAIEAKVNASYESVMALAHGNVIEIAPSLRQVFNNATHELAADNETIIRLRASIAQSSHREGAITAFTRAFESAKSSQEKPLLQARKKAERVMGEASHDRWLIEQQTRFNALLSKHDTLAQNEAIKRDNAIKNAKKTLETVAPQWQEALDQGESNKAKTLAQKAQQAEAVLHEHRAADVGKGLSHQLVELKSETNRLEGWKKFGGAVSRESLLEESQRLVQAGLGEQPLNKEISRLRAHWKQIDQSQGGAPKSMWDQFNAAIAAAYAPIKEQQHIERTRRSDNLKAREAHCALIEAKSTGDAAALLPKPGVVSASTATSFVAFIRDIENLKIQWRQMGPLQFTVPHAKQAEITERYEKGLAPLEQLIADARNIEKLKREKMIVEATLLTKDASAKDAVDRAKALRERWNELAKMLPLARAEEQALYERFNGALNSMFGARDEARKTQIAESDAARVARMSIVQSLSDAVGQLTTAPNESSVELAESLTKLRKAMGEAKAAWHQAPDVPPPVAKPLNDQFKRTTTDAERLAEKLANTLHLAANKNLLATLALFQQNDVRNDAELVSQVEQQLTANPLQAKLQLAFTEWSKRLATGTEQSKTAHAEADAIILDLELIAQVDSPAAFKDARLKRSVERLAQAMRGDKAQASSRDTDVQAGLVRLTKAAGSLTAEQMARLNKVLAV